VTPSSGKPHRGPRRSNQDEDVAAVPQANREERRDPPAGRPTCGSMLRCVPRTTGDRCTPPGHRGDARGRSQGRVGPGTRRQQTVGRRWLMVVEGRISVAYPLCQGTSQVEWHNRSHACWHRPSLRLGRCRDRFGGPQGPGPSEDRADRARCTDGTDPPPGRYARPPPVGGASRQRAPRGVGGRRAGVGSPGGVGSTRRTWTCVT
jgi:hypothetical protein